MNQQIRFCSTADGVRLAYSTSGAGAPVVKAGNWLTNLEFDGESPVWRHWLKTLGDGFTLVRYDERGGGLSDRDVAEFSYDLWVDDLATVIDSAGVDRFAMVGISGGGALAIGYAVRHPERVAGLVLYGCYTRGRAGRGPRAREEEQALQALVRVGWGKDNPAFRRVFTNLLVPEATEEQMRWFEDLQRSSMSAENAIRVRAARDEVDVTELARRVEVPTLVLHAREDAMVPLDEGRTLAGLIPQARFVPLEGRNHILLESEPAWRDFVAEYRSFLEGVWPESAGTPPSDSARLAEITQRERDVLTFVAEGATNEDIAERLFLSERTVERHLSNIYAKLGVSGKAARAAAAAAFSRGS
jgi:pimeloyl-ACP methyl ester carboxylesterase/DNA-binding CsgD family transcriptional regulator